GPRLTTAPVVTPVTILSARSLLDLTINMLGPVEIFRDLARPFAADAWTTRRARDILCFIASRRHHRAPKDAIIETFWGETDLKTVEKNFHPTMSHIRKALNSNQPLKQNFLVYRDGDYQLNPEFSYRIDTVEFDRLIADGETPYSVAPWVIGTGATDDQGRLAGFSSRGDFGSPRAPQVFKGSVTPGSANASSINMAPDVLPCSGQIA